MIIDTEYVTEQLNYSIETVEAEGIKVNPEDIFEVYIDRNTEELIVVIVSDFIEIK